MPDIECVGEADLRAFLLGQLPERVARAVSGHLDACAECEAAARRLDRHTDPLIRALRRAANPAAADANTVSGPDSLGPTGADAAAAPPGLPRPIAGYEVLGELGRGGMSVVYLARQAHPARLVALKMILAGAHAGADRRARFLAEADAIARLQHPHIVQIYEVGQHEGLPFLSLEYVRGGSLAQQLAGTPQPPRAAAALVEKLARAVQHAHQHGVVHRDLKPANILLAFSREPPASAAAALAGGSRLNECVPKISDFGLAKQERPGLTASGAIVGTPSYMAPEQARGDNPAVGPLADVYALGAILYELLTGRPPFQAPTVLETLAQVVCQEPVAPSQLQAQLPHDLSTICLKCLRKEPQRRYAGAGELADDLGRYLAGRPVRARAVGLAERCWRWGRRNPAVAGLGAGLLLALVLGLAGVVWKWREADHRADAEAAQRRRADAKLWEAYLAEAQAIRRSRTMGQRFQSLAAIRKALTLPVPPGHSLGELRNAAASALALPDVEVVKEWPGWPPGTTDLRFDGALERYARVDKQGNVSVRRVADDTEIVRIPGPGSETNLFLSPDGHFLAVHHVRTRRLKVWRLTDPKPVPVCEESGVHQLSECFSPDSQRLAYCQDGSVVVRPLGKGRLTRWPVKARDASGVFFPNDHQLAFHTWVNGQHVYKVLDLRTGAVQASLPHGARIASTTWARGGRVVATCCDDERRIQLWDTATGQLTGVLERHKHDGVNLVFTPDGDLLLGNDWSYLLRVWDVHSGRQVFSTPLSYHMYPFWSPDGRLPIHDGNNVKLIRIARGRAFRTLSRRTAAGLGGYATDFGGVALRRDGRLLAGTTEEGSCALVDPASGAELGVIRGNRTIPVAFETSGALLAWGSAGLCRWPVSEDRATGRCRMGPPQLLLNFHSDDLLFHGSSADGRVLAIPNRHRGALLLHRDRRRPPVVLGPQEDVRSCAVSPDGRWVATGSHGTEQNIGAKVWDAASGRLVKDLPVGGACAVGFSPDGKWLVTTGGGFRLWAVGTWKEGPSLGGEGVYLGFAFSPDSKVLAVENETGVVRLVEVATGREYVRLDAPVQTRLCPQCFTPDGSQLIALGRESQALHVWDLRRVRAGLKELGLDWEQPDYPPAKTPPARPLRIEVVQGK
jgi:WD40 repeat protein